MSEFLSQVEQRAPVFLPLAEAIGFSGRQLTLVDETRGPGASHKDRPVAAMLNSAALQPGNEVVDYTTGSAGCSVAALAQAMGLRARLFIPDETTPERVEFMRRHGAEVVLTPADRAQSERQVWVAGALDAAKAYVEVNRRAVLLNQSGNVNNAAAFHALGAQILAYFGHEQRPTHIVSAAGTGATIVGLGQAVRSFGVRTVAVEPHKSASTWAEKFGGAFKHQPHTLLGTGAGAASPIVRAGIDRVDEVIRVDDEEAYAVCRELQACGLDFGPTTGANVIAARVILRKDPGARVVVIAHDKGERYRSRGL